MQSRTKEDPYLVSWLKRTRRQLAPSGRLSEVALILSHRTDNTPEFWTTWLRQVLEGDIRPSLNELTTIDRIIAPPKKKKATMSEAFLF